MVRSRYHECCAILLFLAVAQLVGCSDRPRTYPTAGSVVFQDGTPLAGGRIELRSRDYPYSARGRIDGEGKFRLTTFKQDDGAIAGSHQVIVLPEAVLNLEDPQEHLGHLRPVNRKLSRYDTTWLEVTIEPKRDNQLLITIE